MSSNALPPLPNVPLPEGLLRLADWGLIRAEGADAATFLQGQLTQDVQGLAVGQVRLAGYCSAKGRLLASFVVLREGPECFWLACSADLLAPTLKRLRMFVLRAKCSLEDASPTHGVYGRMGPAGAASEPQAVAWASSPDAGGWWVHLPDVLAWPRSLWIGPAASAPAGSDAAPLQAAWRWLEVASGIPRVQAATVEQFVPQMVNLELVGGVSFKKGCYPGQEVVARSQYRGTLKRRMVLAAGAADAQAGQEVFHSDDATQPAGVVVLAASGAGLPSLALLAIKLTATAGGRLHLGAPDGPALDLIRLPYEIPQDAN